MVQAAQAQQHPAAQAQQDLVVEAQVTVMVLYQRAHPCLMSPQKI